jgi:hypothetical protein
MKGATLTWASWFSSIPLLCLFLSFACTRVSAAPDLTILSDDSNGVAVAWPDTGSYDLQTNSSLIAPNWGTYGGPIFNSNGTNSAIVQRLDPSEFFRLEEIVATGFVSPTNISGMAYYWNYNDLTNDGAVSEWKDEITGLVMSNESSTVFPSNNTIFPGLNSSQYFTQWALTGPLSVGSSNFSLWMVIRPFANGIVLGNDQSEGIFAGNLSPSLVGIWGSSSETSSMTMNYADPQTFPYGETYDILDSGGNIYSNGVLMAQGIGQPTNDFVFNSIGSYTYAPEYSLDGVIQYIGIWTNHLLSATDAANLDNWYWNYDVTNVTNGLIAWWKLNDGSGTAAADSWGTNTMYFGGTGNVWTNDAMVDGEALYFNGNGWLTNVDPSFADNLPVMTVSCWVNETGLSGNNITGSLVEKGVYAGFNTGNIGWALQGDGVSNVYFGVYDVGDSWAESPHNSGAPDYPIVGDSNWRFLVGEYTNAPGVGIVPVIYIDGAQIITGGEVAYGAVTNISVPDNAIFIGAEDEGGAGIGSPAGIINDVRIYNRMLSLQEINDLYKWRGEPP